MSDFNKMLQKIKDLKDKMERQENNSLLKLLYAKVSLLEEMIKNLKLSDLVDKTNASKTLNNSNSSEKTNNSPEIPNNSKPEISFDEKIKRLRDVATKKIENDKIIYLLYRPTVQFEYENSISGSEFVTKDDTEWIADFEESTIKRNDNSPIISAWIPESQVKDVLNAFGPENNTWGELGTNPNKNKYRILVKPGSYKLHQELKKSKSFFSPTNVFFKKMSKDILNVTSDRHIESPGKDSSDLMPNSGKPNPKKHIRADTMTHMNIVNENDLKKVYSVNGNYYPEKSDKDGIRHPTKPQIKTTDHKGNAVWRYDIPTSQKMDWRFAENYKKNIKNYSPKAQGLITSLFKKIAQDPHRHNISTEADDDGNEHFMRLRHLSYALGQFPGYSITEDEKGIKIQAERHKKPFEIHTWHYDGKNLKFLGKTPIKKLNNGGFNENKRIEMGRSDGRTKENSEGSRARFAGRGDDERFGISKSSKKLQPPEVSSRGFKWLVKIKGLDGFHPVKDIQDLGDNKGNNYILEDGKAFHQSMIEDLIIEKPKKITKTDKPENLSPRDKEKSLELLNNLIKSSAKPLVKFNPEHSKIIADAYENMKHDPEHPEVKAAYEALINETKKQYQDMLNSGIKISKMRPDQENPYKSSKDLHFDLENNKHLWYYPTEFGFSSNNVYRDHPMLQPTEFKDSEGKPMLANDLFRIVHDYRGHYLGGKSTFGPIGEHQAYLTHKKDFSPLAQKALATETMGQNSWVTAGPYAEHNMKNPEKTIYADQKAGLLPDYIINGRWHE